MQMRSASEAAGLAVPRTRMLDLLSRRISDPRVMAAIADVPREEFVPAVQRHRAYDDAALPIGEGQTISQPLIVALMIRVLAIRPDARVLEVGSGSGYAAAVLSRLAREVIAVERIAALREKAEATISNLGYTNVRFYPAGVTLGHNDRAPYDAILVSAGAPHVPRSLVEQLSRAGRMVIPVASERSQELVLVASSTHGIELSRLGPCAFVPLIGEDAWPR